MPEISESVTNMQSPVVNSIMYFHEQGCYSFCLTVQVFSYPFPNSILYRTLMVTHIVKVMVDDCDHNKRKRYRQNTPQVFVLEKYNIFICESLKTNKTLGCYPQLKKMLIVFMFNYWCPVVYLEVLLILLKCLVDTYLFKFVVMKKTWYLVLWSKLFRLGKSFPE